MALGSICTGGHSGSMPDPAALTFGHGCMTAQPQPHLMIFHAHTMQQHLSLGPGLFIYRTSGCEIYPTLNPKLACRVNPPVPAPTSAQRKPSGDAFSPKVSSIVSSTSGANPRVVRSPEYSVACSGCCTMAATGSCTEGTRHERRVAFRHQACRGFVELAILHAGLRCTPGFARTTAGAG